MKATGGEDPALKLPHVERGCGVMSRKRWKCKWKTEVEEWKKRWSSAESSLRLPWCPVLETNHLTLTDSKWGPKKLPKASKALPWGTIPLVGEGRTVAQWPEIVFTHLQVRTS